MTLQPRLPLFSALRAFKAGEGLCVPHSAISHQLCQWLISEVAADPDLESNLC